jgi:2-dehydro-3-deoxyphosphogluconate aldolase/(4S)-4-hydroxy-2-oxoglutarate aldolase
MIKQDKLAAIEHVGIIPAVRVTSSADALFASEAVVSGGIPVVEITMTTPDATSVITSLVRANPQCIVGAGSVANLDIARACIDAGAAFLTTTGLDQELIDFALLNDVSLIPGALTPTEIMTARRAGASLLKIFPCSSVGGASYIRSLCVPFPDMRFIASGGVSQENASAHIRSGATALGIGHALLPTEAIRTRNVSWIHELARRFIETVKIGRKSHIHH